MDPGALDRRLERFDEGLVLDGQGGVPGLLFRRHWIARSPVRRHVPVELPAIYHVKSSTDTGGTVLTQVMGGGSDGSIGDEQDMCRLHGAELGHRCDHVIVVQAALPALLALYGNDQLVPVASRQFNAE